MQILNNIQEAKNFKDKNYKLELSIMRTKLIHLSLGQVLKIIMNNKRKRHGIIVNFKKMKISHKR